MFYGEVNDALPFVEQHGAWENDDGTQSGNMERGCDPRPHVRHAVFAVGTGQPPKRMYAARAESPGGCSDSRLWSNPNSDPNDHQRYEDHGHVDREPPGWLLLGLFGHGFLSLCEQYCSGKIASVN